MENSLRFIVKKFNKKDGSGSFTSASTKLELIKGYGRLATQFDGVDTNTKVRIAIVGQAVPQKEGIYSVSFDDKDIWRDAREDVVKAGKYVVRIKALKPAEFVKDLPSFADKA